MMDILLAATNEVQNVIFKKIEICMFKDVLRPGCGQIFYEFVY